MMYPVYDFRLQMTQVCTQKCRHCFADSKKTIKGELSTDEIIKFIKNDLIPRGLKWVTLTGGEPLIRFDDCLEITKFCAKNEIIPRLNTGGLVPDIESKIETLISEGMETIMLPLKSFYRDKHDGFCGVTGCFDQTINTFKTIAKLNGTSCLRTTLFNWNIEDIPKLISLARDIGISKFRFRPELPSGRALKHNEYPTINQVIEVTKLVLMEKKSKNFPNIEFLNPCFQFLYSDKVNDYSQCPCGITKLFLTSKGSIKPCGFYKNTFGNIRETSFEDLWNSNPHFVIKKIRSSYIFKQCTDCKYWNICKGGCPVVIYNENDNFDGYNRYCPIQHNIQY